MSQVPSVSSEVLPSHVLRVMPQCAHLKLIEVRNVGTHIQLSNLIFITVTSVRFTCPGVSPVCQRAFLRCSPGPVVELTTLIDSPE